MNRDNIKTIGQRYTLTADEETANYWQGCASLCKSIASCYEKINSEENARVYWQKAARYERKILDFIERTKLGQKARV